MRKFLFLMTMATVLIGCKSNEEKALEAIKNEMFKTLYDFESYEPIDTKIDSAFRSAYTDSVILKNGFFISEAMKEVKEALNNVDDANRSMDIWGDSFTSTGRREFEKAKIKADTNLKMAELYMKRGKEKQDSIRALASKIKPDFYGWKVTHRFRCKTKGGHSSIGIYMYVFDKDFNNIIYMEDTEDEGLLKARNFIREALEDKE